MRYRARVVRERDRSYEKLSFVFAGSVVLSAALQLAAVSCAEEPEECGGAPFPSLPKDQGPARIVYADRSDRTGNANSQRIELTKGTVSVKDQQLQIAYKVDGTQHTAVYAIKPSR